MVQAKHQHPGTALGASRGSAATEAALELLGWEHTTSLPYTFFPAFQQVFGKELVGSVFLQCLGSAMMLDVVVEDHIPKLHFPGCPWPLQLVQMGGGSGGFCSRSRLLQTLISAQNHLQLCVSGSTSALHPNLSLPFC